MCVVSNLGDSYRDNFAPRWPQSPVQPMYPYVAPHVPPLQITREEFEALKKEVESLKELLKAAKKFDEETNQPDCHMDDKVEFIKKLAEYVGVDLEDIFKK